MNDDFLYHTANIFSTETKDTAEDCIHQRPP